MAVVYRLIMETAPGRVDTGASYPQCSRATPEQCNPMQFASVSDAVGYAGANGETPIHVASAEEAWSVIEGQKPVTDAMVIGGPTMFGFLSNLDPVMIGAAILGAFILFRRK